MSAECYNDDFSSPTDQEIDDQDFGEDAITFEALKVSDENLNDRDIILFPIETDENGNEVVASGKNKVFDQFFNLNKKIAVQFLFLNENGDRDGWVLHPNDPKNLFNNTGFPNHREAITEYLEHACNLVSDGTRNCFFDVYTYNNRLETTTPLVPYKDYSPFCPFKDISPQSVTINGLKYFRFPATFYKTYKDLYFRDSPSFEVTLLGLKGNSYGSLFDQELPFENKAHYLELTDPLVPLFLSLMRKYDFAYFDRDKTDSSKWVMSTSLTHPTLVRLYAQNQKFINDFMTELQVREATLEGENENPFVITTKDKDGVYHMKISILFMEHVLAKASKVYELSPNFNKLSEMNISFAKQERYVCQRIELSEESSDENRPFYLIIENSIYEKNMPLVQKYFDC